MILSWCRGKDHIEEMVTALGYHHRRRSRYQIQSNLLQAIADPYHDHRNPGSTSYTSRVIGCTHRVLPIYPLPRCLRYWNFTFITGLLSNLR